MRSILKVIKVSRVGRAGTFKEKQGTRERLWKLQNSKPQA